VPRAAEIILPFVVFPALRDLQPLNRGSITIGLDEVRLTRLYVGCGPSWSAPRGWFAFTRGMTDEIEECFFWIGGVGAGA
jgi:hypothetical protein